MSYMWRNREVSQYLFIQYSRIYRLWARVINLWDLNFVRQEM